MDKINVKTETSVFVGNVPIDDVLEAARFLAHEVLEELSIYRQEHNLDPLEFDVEGTACEFLDLIGD